MQVEKIEEMPERIITDLSKPLKSLDASIYKIAMRIKGDGTVDFYEVEFSFPESMGERGFLQTAFFDQIPDVSEIKGFCLDEIREFIKDNDNFWANSYEEQAVKKLKKIIRTEK